MKKIKPEVIGYKRVHDNGEIGRITFFKGELSRSSMAILVLSAGSKKAKWRPVYK